MDKRNQLFAYLHIFASILTSCLVACAAHSSINEVESQVKCTFDAGLCSWHQSVNDNFDWTLISGETPTTNTGPSNDHTLGTAAGKYIFIETSAPRKLNERAALMSPLIDTWNHNYMCFSMWYFAYGSNIGDLRIILKQSKFVNKTETLWINSFQGSLWKQTTVSILPTGPFQIIIEGTVGSGYLGDIAVDDVAVTGGKCSNGTSGTNPSPVG
ncbi:MAM domain-containing glycosylphosphatidylinositol anchor protein 1-like [Mercenaria mercenaria]|uniref:MAM domain-containing glycosylphosphatidylinositol anchor protein 1-like n=1 Tax=Mercenaria mercenaria TaxID=6596 RepID=UPI001E1D7CD2|nr:MAM domain-containing glycosylphosphatidylinositol anchor protein 1-like [Mercenaria mercenaria]